LATHACRHQNGAVEVIAAVDGALADVPTIVSVGTFDGVHLGHQAVLRALRETASEHRARATVVLLGDPGGTTPHLTTVSLRLELLAAEGVDLVVTVDPPAAPAQLVPIATTASRLTATALVQVTGDAGGADSVGIGTGAFETALTEAGVAVRRVPPVRVAEPGAEPKLVSADRIRALVLDGAVESAALLLGRPHEVRGVVGHGDARGRTLGFPTANIEVPADIVLPADGVYAGHYRRPGGSVHATAISLGRRPTFYEERGARLLEAHLLEFDDQLYDEVGAVQFEYRLRPQRRYETVGELVEQLHRDVVGTRSALAGGRAPAPPAEGP